MSGCLTQTCDHLFAFSFLQENAQLRKNEQAKYGIYFDDDYDYMQHLRDADEINEVELVESFRVQREPQTQKV